MKRRRRELHDAYPCAMPTGRRWCPRHHAAVGAIALICRTCRTELYEQLRAEYAGRPE